MAEHKDYFPLIFRRCVLAILGARLPEDVVFEEGMLEQLVLLSEAYLKQLTGHLHRIATIQRRDKPMMHDLALMMFENEINVTDLEKEAFHCTPLMEESLPVATLNALHFDPEEEPVNAASEPFFMHHKHLAPSMRPTPPSIPAWMPALPPDHTYMHTPSHSSTVRDLRHVRMELVDEGRMAERALQRMLGDKGSASVMELRKATGADRPRSGMTVIDQTVKIEPDIAMVRDSPEEIGTREVGTIEGEAGETTKAAGEAGEAVAQPTEPAEPAAATETTDPTAAEPSTEPATVIEPADKPVPKLKFKIHVPEEPPKLKLSLSKPKKKKDTFLGKRPRVDILALASGQKREKSDASMDIEETDIFQQALAAISQ